MIVPSELCAVELNWAFYVAVPSGSIAPAHMVLYIERFRVNMFS